MIGRVTMTVIMLLFAVDSSAQSLAERLRPLMNQGLAQRSNSSLMVVDVESGEVVASENPNRKVIPASNLKLVTTAAALNLLGADYEFKTSLLIRGEVSAGTLNGDVLVRGGGDPSLGERFYEDGGVQALEELAIALRREGVERITGDLIIEYGFFDEEWVHPSWPVDQLVFWYEAPISSPAVQEGTVLVRVTPGAPGEPGNVELKPPNSFVTIENSSVTRRRGRGVFIGRQPGTNTIIVRGNVRPGGGPTEVPVTVKYPVEYFANVFERILRSNGIELSSDPVIRPRDLRFDWRVIETIDSPLAVAIYVVNKQSQNHYAEQLLKTIGAETEDEGTWTAGARAIEKWMTSVVGVDPESISIVDGSGMSRENRISAKAFTDLLLYMWNDGSRAIFVSSLPYSGERSSKLRRRMNREPYSRNVFAKTGYIAKVVGLSGYVKATSGKVYAFSLLFNDFPTWTGPMYQLQNSILETVVDHG
ncbi:MAG: D-alanyl-D-alanine carboxypeptidase/D-alanyl-D-alanine-endopeptidase [Thermoanaerobaculia bacterium]|nr:D-alanyl-D-alanine carboxypeptidase/D-alanyl-D-alanine-endopeptidase [Thermoanaerobaculia bacterium]